MRIMILTSQLNLGSAELLSVDLALNLKKMNEEVFLVSLQPISDFNNIDLKDSAYESLYVDSLNIKPKANILKFFLSIINLRSFLIKHNIEIIETSSPTIASISAISTIGTKVKQISGLHETFYKGKNRIKGGNTNSIRKRIFALITNLKDNVYFYAVSDYVKQTWINYSGINEEKVRVIYNAIELPKFYETKETARIKLRDELNVPHKTKIALCVGRIVSYRRQDFLIDAFIKNNSDENLLLLIVGEPDFSISSTIEIVENIKKSLKSNYKNNKIRLLGYRKDIFNIMLGSDLFVNPTDMEGFGMSIVEAMYVGLPIVASRVEAVPEIVPSKGNILFQKDDKDELIRSILKISQTPKNLTEKISNRNKLYANKFVSREKRSVKMLEYMKYIYQK